MGQCVSLKAGVVVAASEHHGSPSYRIMDKPSKNHNDSKGASKKGAPLTRGTATSFGFRRRPTSGIPMPVTAGSYGNDVTGTMHQRSKSAGPPEQERRRDEDNCHQRFHSSSSGRSTPRLAPPKKEAVTSGNALRTNRFGFRQPQQRYTNKVGDICSSHTASHYNQDKVHSLQQQHHQQQLQHQQIQQMHQMQHQPQREIQQDNYIIGRQSSRSSQAHPTVPSSKLTPSPVNNPPAYGGHSSPMTIETDRRGSGIPEPISKYTLHTSHLPLPQYAIRMNEANPKVAKTAANQSRQVSTASKCPTSSKESSGTEDSGVGSQQGYPVDHETVRGLDYFDSSAAAAAMVRRSHGRPRNLRMVLSGKSFDVRDVEDDSTVTEISVIPLPKSFATSGNLNSGFVRDRTVQYQRILNKDNRYTDSTTSMSTTSSEGYGEGLGEEKVYKDRSHTEKTSSIKSDFSPPSSDDPEYGHGEAMADEYSLSSSDECRANPNQHLKTITNAAKSGSLPKNTLRSVLLTIEDPAFAAAAATTTSLIDDETSPADSLVDSLTASITQSDGKNSRKECIMDRSGNTLEDDSPGTPTNASNSLSLSEGREFFDDEIADQPGLTFDETLRTGTADTHSGGRTGNVVTENSHTLVESAPKLNMPQGRIAENGSVRRIARAESVDTLSPCESITSDDFMLDYDCSEGHSDDETNRPLDYSTVIYDLDEATMRDVIRELSAPKGTSQNHSNSNLANNNISTGNNNNNNHNTATGKLIKRVKQLQIGEEATGGDYYQLTYPN